MFNFQTVQKKTDLYKSSLDVDWLSILGTVTNHGKGYQPVITTLQNVVNIFKINDYISLNKQLITLKLKHTDYNFHLKQII